MILTYPEKKDQEDIINHTKKSNLKSIKKADSLNKLIFGDNLGVLKALIEDYNLREKIDLIYTDPPFATNNCFKIGQDRANTVSMCNDHETAYSDFIIDEAYLEFLRERLVFLKELLSPVGSLYLHIDCKMGHYVKVIMDEIFGRNNFRNDITRIKCNPKNFKRKAYGNFKDLVLFYTKGKDYIWNDLFIPFTKEDIDKLFKKVDKNGRRYTTIPLHAPGETVNGKTGQEWKGMKPPKGRHWRSEPDVLESLDEQGLIEWSPKGVPRKKIYADEKQGKKMQDIWEFKDPQYPSYPTEKSLELLKFIIQASSNEESIVLDCFCGSGTTLEAAQLLNRKWIGIDQSELAIKVCQKRLNSIPPSLFTEKVQYEVLQAYEDSNFSFLTTSCI